MGGGPAGGEGAATSGLGLGDGLGDGLGLGTAGGLGGLGTGAGLGLGEGPAQAVLPAEAVAIAAHTLQFVRQEAVFMRCKCCMVTHRTLQGAKHRPALATAPAYLGTEHAAGSAIVASSCSTCTESYTKAPMASPRCL